MGSNNILVKDYLESLKEDKELDYLFPILLSLMGFKIVTTAKESKGQPQYGKDIIATGKDEGGILKRYYFELKGHADKDITQTSFLKKDGIMESIREAQLTSFKDSSLPGFNDLPVQIVVVHNGILNSNTRPTFEGFINQTFPNGGFERWDIYKLTDLFSEYLFGEYLFTDQETIRLFKRTLVLLDAQDNDFLDFKQLVNLQVNKIESIQGRALNKFFATMNLLSLIIIHYSKENNNLFPARECVTYLLLRVWSWILSKNLQDKSAVQREFRKLVDIHYQLLDDYFIKTAYARVQKDGLFSENGGLFESIAYPIRSFDYISHQVYYFEAKLAQPEFKGKAASTKKEQLLNEQLRCLIQTMNNNKACCRPLLDNHSIPIISVCLFILRHRHSIKHGDSKEIIQGYLTDVLNNILIIKKMRKRYPEMHNNMSALTEFEAKHDRPYEYQDSSSLLITMLFEMIAVIDCKSLYDHFRASFATEINLQNAYSEVPIEELEVSMFSKRMHREYYVETNIELPEEFDAFKNNLINKPREEKEFRTDKAGFGFLRILAHHHFKNEFFVDEWRKYLHEN